MLNMILNYNKLLKLMIDKGINKAQLREKAGISTNVLAKLGKNEPVHMDVLVKICETLNCDIKDIMRVVPNDKS